MNAGRSDTYLALDIGGTKTTGCVLTVSGEVIAERTVPTEADAGYARSWARVVEVADAVLQESASRPRAIGVSIGGPVDGEAGAVHSPPNLPGWDDVPVKGNLEARFGIPTFIEHDAKAGALAEWMFGAGRGTSNLIFLTLGTGLGAGAIVDGRLLHGRANNFGEVGHWRIADDGPDLYGKRGSWEGYSSGAGLAARARTLQPRRWGDEITAVRVFEAARVGDLTALALIAEFALKLGTGLALMIDLLAPEIVVLGSMAVRSGDLFIPEVERVLAAECSPRNLPCPVVASLLGDELGTRAALAVALAGLEGVE